MRFAWLRENEGSTEVVVPEGSGSLKFIRTIYNIAFWAFLIPFFTAIDYGTGFIVFTVIVLVRFGANLYINALNFNPEQYTLFPFRTP